MSRLAALLPVLCLLAAACGGDSSTPTSPSTPRGEYSATDVRAGTGAVATAGRRVTVNYTGWFFDPTGVEQKGRQFQTNSGYPFTLGVGEVIRGWDQGVAGMQVGGLRRLVLPPELAYGSQGSQNGAIPPNATLVFDVELTAVQ